MNQRVRLASAIIVSLIVSLASIPARAYVWGPQDLTTLREYHIDQIAIPYGSSNIAPNHKVVVADTTLATWDGVTQSEARWLDWVYQNCVNSGRPDCDATNWRPSGRTWQVFKLGTPDTFPVTRFYILPTNSHVYVAANEMYEASPGNNVPVLTILRQYPDLYRDEGEKFAVMSPLPGFAEGKLPLPQACGNEKQSGLTAMIRFYNGGASKPSQPESVSLAVRFNDGNHQFSTRNDAAYMADLKQVPGWEIATRDMDSTGRKAGVFCVPSMTEKIIQTTAASMLPQEAWPFAGPFIQAQVHDLSRFTLNGSQINIEDYTPTLYRCAGFEDQTFTGGFDANPNRGVLAITRANGGYVEYGSSGNQITPPSVFPKSALNVDSGWQHIKVDEETSIVYAVSVSHNGVIWQTKFHAYSPVTNSYVWQYTMPEEYREYYVGDSELHLAGNYLVTYFPWFTSARDNFKSVIVVIPLTYSGATPEVRIIDLPGPNKYLSDFAFDAKANIGTFVDAGGKALIHLNFSNWSIATEPVPFEPFAVMVSPMSSELYATHLPKTSDLVDVWTEGALWKRAQPTGTWVQVAQVGRSPRDISLVTIDSTPKLMVFGVAGNVNRAAQVVDFVDLKTGTLSPRLPDSVFSPFQARQGLAGATQHQ